MIKFLKLLGLLLFVFFLQLNAGLVEGSLRPVVTDVKITRTESAQDGYTRIWGEFFKARGCRFEGLHFYLDRENGGPLVDLVFESGSKKRDAGFEDFGPWRVQLTEEQLADRVSAVVYHKCPLVNNSDVKIDRPWKTVTNFYP